MKKIWMGLAAVVLVMTLGVTGALAAGRHGQGLRYTDANRDGICDYYGTGCGTGFVDADGDGVCDYRAGSAYSDRNGDGVCDHYTEGGHHSRCAW